MAPAAPTLVDTSAPAANAPGVPWSADGGGGTLYECSLFGIVDAARERLLRTLIASICGGDESIQPALYHEMAYVPCVETPIGPSRKEDVVLRVRSDLDVSDPARPQPRSHTLVVYGHPEPRSASKAVNVRPVTYARLHGPSDVCAFVQLLGYQLYSDFVRKGYEAECGDGVRVSVYRVYYAAVPGDVRTIEPADPTGSWVVHARSEVPSHESTPQAAEKLRRLKGVFQELVALDTVDHVYLQNKIPYSA